MDGPDSSGNICSLMVVESASAVTRRVRTRRRPLSARSRTRARRSRGRRTPPRPGRRRRGGRGIPASQSRSRPSAVGIRSRQASPAQRDHRERTQPPLVTVSAVYRPGKRARRGARSSAEAGRRIPARRDAASSPRCAVARFAAASRHNRRSVQRVLKPVLRSRNMAAACANVLALGGGRAVGRVSLVRCRKTGSAEVRS
jgi:hypothetical protein